MASPPITPAHDSSFYLWKNKAVEPQKIAGIPEKETRTNQVGRGSCQAQIIQGSAGVSPCQNILAADEWDFFSLCCVPGPPCGFGPGGTMPPDTAGKDARRYGAR